MSGVLGYIPGLLLILGISIPAMAIQRQIVVNGKEVVSAVAAAIVLGILIRNVLGVPEACRAGTSLAVKRILRVGIALMGAQLSLMQVLQSGARSLIAFAEKVAGAFGVIEMAAKLSAARKNGMAEGAHRPKIAEQRIADLCGLGREVRLADGAVQKGSSGNNV